MPLEDGQQVMSAWEVRLCGGPLDGEKLFIGNLLWDDVYKIPIKSTTGSLHFLYYLPDAKLIEEAEGIHYIEAKFTHAA
jgi:hypothetical protein